MGPQDSFALQLLKASGRLAKKYAASVPWLYETAANTLDNIVDAPKVALDYYAREFKPTPQMMDKLQNVKDFVGEFSNVPMAPPFLGRGKSDRGYLPIANMAMGSDMSGGPIGFDSTYPQYAANSNAQLASREAEELEHVRKPFNDWEALHSAVMQRYQDTAKFQSDMRKDPRIIKAAGGDPRRMAAIIHQATIARNNNLRNSGKLFNAADSVRGYRFYKDPLEPRGSMKSGNMHETGFDLPDMTGRQPYIIR
jgi:hypothetical protein